MADASSNTDATERDNWIPNLAGKRRWWPVRCTAIDLDALRSDQPQLWAEALVRYGSGERWWLHEDSLVQAAAAEQDARAEIDPWEESVLRFANGHNCVTTTEVLVDGIRLPLERCGRQETMRVASILRKAGWQRKYMTVLAHTGKKEPRWCFVKPGFYDLPGC